MSKANKKAKANKANVQNLNYEFAQEVGTNTIPESCDSSNVKNCSK